MLSKFLPPDYICYWRIFVETKVFKHNNKRVSKVVNQARLHTKLNSYLFKSHKFSFSFFFKSLQFQDFVARLSSCTGWQQRLALFVLVTERMANIFPSNAKSPLIRGLGWRESLSSVTRLMGHRKNFQVYFGQFISLFHRECEASSRGANHLSK